MNGKHTRYQQLEQYMTIALIADAVLFFIFLITAGAGVMWLKSFSAILSALISALSLAYLFITREFSKKRSLWMTVAAGAILVCIIISLLVNYPSVSPYKEKTVDKDTMAISIIYNEQL